MRFLILLFVVLCSLDEPLNSQVGSHVVLRAVPETFVRSDWKSVKREALSPKDREAQAIIIVKVDQSYYWASRDNRRLTYSKSGYFHNFIDTHAGGLIKVFNPREYPDIFSGELDLGTHEKGSDYRVQVFESISLGLLTYTYWGKAREFNP